MVFLRTICVFLIVFALQTKVFADMQVKLNPSKLKDKDLQTLLKKRYSCRSFQQKKLSSDDVASILWAACGKTQDAVTHATRTIPSAGATYPLEIYLVVGRGGVEGIKEGVYHYSIEGHALEPVLEDDKREELAAACLGQSFISDAPVSLVIAAQPNRTTGRYGERASRYIDMEAGHAAQNVYLAVTDLGLGTVEIGAFNDGEVKRLLKLKIDHIPLLIMPIGYPAS